MRRPRRVLLVVLAVIALVIVGVVLAVQPIATWQTRRALDGLPDMQGRFAAVHVSLLHLSYEIDGLRLDKLSSEGKAQPFFSARRIRARLLGRELLHGRLVARVDLDAPRVEVVQTGAPPEAAKPKVPEPRRKLLRLPPFLVDRVQIRGGELVWVDATEPNRPELRFHDLEATIENFASRPRLTRGQPTVVAARGVLQRTGKASFFATGDPLAKRLTFAGQGRVEGLVLAELGPLVGAKSGVAPNQGTLDLSMRFQSDDGRLSGGVRPVLNNPSTEPVKPGLGPKLKALLADATLNIFKDDVPGRHAVATTIPIEGRLDSPDLQLVPTILGVVRNAFVRGVSDSLHGLPPPKAKERQSTLEQARSTLGGGRPPRAQPPEKGK